ncbi:MAG: 23S rRNA (adenine(2503)-C(2))-methyltransferase RlmN [Anaerosomatales bacterium]|nr:23S rRNA (adenine(2503)-C(2))-methyltransferase RlmN [Anaerosomatales bacterium]MDT8433731.1 23S rRNA (adenine(2503)-C(2))-methyltransferase RlmN [Anaerosomatales bacterium]
MPGIGVLGLDRGGLERWLAGESEPRFRTGQLVRWLYQRGADSYEQMTDLPAGLRATLADRLPLLRPRLEAREVSALDDTRRYLWRLADGATVESVGLPADDRLTVCFSTQAGCAMGCSFCATGAGGLVRDLGAGEMAEQVRLVGADFGARVTNAVAMGQGEPFTNYDATLGGVRLMNDPDALGIGARHITISTCGLIGEIERLASEPEQFTLAISLHSAVQATRNRLMPSLRAQPLPRLQSALETYATATGRRPSLEYALVEGVNDSAEELAALIGFCTGLLCHVNLIPVNPVGGLGHARPGGGRVMAFLDGLAAAGIQATIRTERGTDIEAACGQLTQRHSGPG